MHNNNLKQIRSSCALTQKQVADVLGIERSTYTCYETGKSTPPIETAKKLSKIFDVTLEEIFAEKKDDTSSNVLGENFSDYNIASDMSFAHLNKEEKSLIIKFRLLDNENKKKVLDEISDLNEGSSD
ncbi:MAG: helix-turn-helix transcriptional regulator [Acutalibacteraceae bacterium]